MHPTTVEAIPTAAATQPTRLRLDDPTYTVRLLHYFQRLGARAEIEHDGIVSAAFEDDTMVIADALVTWTQATSVGVTVAPLGPVRFDSPTTAQITDGWQAPVRIGDLLVGKGRITNEQLGEALVEARVNGEMVGQVLLRKRWVFEDELARTLAEQWDLPYLNLALIGVNPRAVPLLPREKGERFAAIPVTFVNGTVQVAFADPSDQAARAAVREHISSVSLAVAEFTDISMLWRRFSEAA